MKTFKNLPDPYLKSQTNRHSELYIEPRDPRTTELSIQRGTQRVKKNNTFLDVDGDRLITIQVRPRYDLDPQIHHPSSSVDFRSRILVVER